MPEMTLEELDKLTTRVIELKEFKEKKDQEKKEAEKAFKTAQAELITALEAHGKTENEGDFGKVKLVTTEYYKMTDKDEAMGWLKDTGDFDALASVNARTFSSHVKQLIAEKRDEGDFVWMPPGVEDATSDYKYVRITK